MIYYQERGLESCMGRGFPGCALPNSTRKGRGIAVRGTITKRSDGRFGVKIDLPRDPETGKRRQKWLGTFATRREAEEALARVLGEVAAGTYTPPSKVTLQEFTERWLRDYAAPRLRATTYRSYERLIQNHVLPTLGLRPLSRVTAADLSRLYREKLDSGLSPRTVRYIHAVLHKLLDTAMKWGVVGRNVADAVEAPAPRRTEVRALGPEEARRLLEAAREEGPQVYAIIALALLTGGRRGEIFGLRWEDVDLDAGTLQVRQALVEVGGKRVMSEPKTAAGRRRVEIPPLAVDALRRHKAAQAERRLLLGPDYDDRDLVFATDFGKPLHPHNWVQRTFRRLLERAGLPHVRFHDLRHSHATLLLARGIHPRVVQERLGHANITLTLQTYSHVLPGMQREAAAKVEELLRPRGRRGESGR